MDDMLRRLAEALGVPALSSEEQQLLLECAREVAHGSERRHAPLSTFLLGVAVGGSDGTREATLPDGVDRIRAVVATRVDTAPGSTENRR